MIARFIRRRANSKDQRPEREGSAPPPPEVAAPPRPEPPGYEELTAELDPRIRGFADAFYTKVLCHLPDDYFLSPDWDAPDNGANRLSLCYQSDREQETAKLGTARVELRGNHFFTKLVTRQVPRDFLQRFPVEEVITRFLGDVRLRGSRSRSGNGYSLSSNKFIITMEVFGEGALGSLAADQTVMGNREARAVARMDAFVEMYAAVYNLLPNGPLRFK